MKKAIFTFVSMLFLSISFAQTYTDYLGAGHNTGVTVTSSSDFQEEDWDETATADKTINGDGLDYETMIFSRFLGQATLGVKNEDIEHAKAIGMEAWLDEQFEIPASSTLDLTWQIYDESYQLDVENGVDSVDLAVHPYDYHFNNAWWTVNMTNEDLLRQRVALALSEIFVVSNRSDLGFYGYTNAAYYDMLAENAFGNYEDLLLQITLHPAMGFYLSALNNPRSNPEENQHPDENYAREVMQLFSIGLFELNQDGTRKVDGDGNYIPSYDNNDIKEFAKIFTGLGAGAILDNPWVDEPQFWLWLDIIDTEVPMAMYDEYHEPGEKHLLHDFVVPAGQTGMEDIEAAIHHLATNENVAPFIGRLLIQRLVTSNPSPEYIARVSAAFNDNGSGERGDLKAVIKAILLDPEARTCEAMTAPHHGMLKEPIVRYTQFFRGMENDSPLGRYWNPGFGFAESTGQFPMLSPSVFNFFSPNYQPIGQIADNDLFAPEFQLHNTRTGIGYINEVDLWAINRMPFYTWQEGNPDISYEVDHLISMMREPDVLLNYLDRIYTHGQLTDKTRDIIKTAVNSLDWPWDREAELDYKLRLAMYLFFISPDYTISR